MWHSRKQRPGAFDTWRRNSTSVDAAQRIYHRSPPSFDGARCGRISGSRAALISDAPGCRDLDDSHCCGLITRRSRPSASPSLPPVATVLRASRRIHRWNVVLFRVPCKLLCSLLFALLMFFVRLTVPTSYAMLVALLASTAQLPLVRRAGYGRSW